MVLALEKRYNPGHQLKRRPTVLMVVSVHVLRLRVSAAAACRFLVATLVNVATIRGAARNVPRRLPATFEEPPRRRRHGTGISSIRSPAAAVRICNSMFHPYVISVIPRLNSMSRRIARNAHMSV